MEKWREETEKKRIENLPAGPSKNQKKRDEKEIKKAKKKAKDTSITPWVEETEVKWKSKWLQKKRKQTRWSN